MTHMSQKKLYKSRTDKVFTGVVGGLGEYFDIDSNLLRLVWALIVVFSGIFPGLIVYILAAIIIPKEPRSAKVSTPPPSSHPDDIDDANEEYKKIV